MATTETYEISQLSHPLLDCQVLSTDLSAPLGTFESPEGLLEMLTPDAPRALPWLEDTKPAVRRLLRHGGFKPSGRNKPASEYLVQAALRGRLGSINLVVDIINAVSYHSGLPISVVDRDLLQGPPRLSIGEPLERYIFNASEQVIEVAGLLCLADDDGPCANAVKDSQRTKTHTGTERILTVIWGTNELPGRTEATAGLYRDLLNTHAS